MGLITKGADPLQEDNEGNSCINILRKKEFSMLELVESRIERHSNVQQQ